MTVGFTREWRKASGTVRTGAFGCPFHTSKRTCSLEHRYASVSICNGLFHLRCAILESAPGITSAPLRNLKVGYLPSIFTSDRFAVGQPGEESMQANTPRALRPASVRLNYASSFWLLFCSSRLAVVAPMPAHSEHWAHSDSANVEALRLSFIRSTCTAHAAHSMSHRPLESVWPGAGQP
jgi:hypothetical protein